MFSFNFLLGLVSGKEGSPKSAILNDFEIILIATCIYVSKFIFNSRCLIFLEDPEHGPSVDCLSVSPQASLGNSTKT